MATTNPFDLLIDDDNDDPIQLIAKLPAVAAPVTKKPAAKLPSKPLPPAQAVQEAKADGQRGGGRFGGRGNGRGGRGGRGFNRDSSENENSYGTNNDFNGGYRPSEDGEVDKSSERRPYSGPRGGYRGGRRGGYTNGDEADGERPRRVFERRSGTGRGNEFKREGAGRGNWGTATDEVALEPEEPVVEVEKNVESEKPAGPEDGVDTNKEIGILITPNAANMCVKCLRSEVDITEGLQKHVIIIHCPECDRYLQPPRTWIKAQLESKELLTFCAKRVKNLNKVRLVHAEFIWTEPHSKRIKVKLKVQKEVLNGAVIEQACMVEYVVQDQMCESCSRVQANPDQWVAAVQLRQHVSHRRTFFYLEQLILKHDAAVRAIRIKQMDHGIDFFFANRNHAVKFVEFIQKVVPIKSRHDKQLVSHDTKSNNYNYKYTFSVEICPICREDLVCLPPKVAANLGNIGPLVICTKISNSIALLDPLTLRHCFLDAEQYWRASFTPLLSSKQLVEYVVLDVDPVSSEVNVGGSKYMLADAQVARVSDFGKNDTMFFVRTHLGHLLNAGDYALGYDLNAANNNDMEIDKYKSLVIPEVILVKKSYEERRQKNRGKPRSWWLKSIKKEVDVSENRGRVDEEKMIDEYEQFLRDIEENPDLRFNISLYRNKEYQPSEMASVSDGEDAPSVPLEELLDDLRISAEDVVDDDDGDEGMEE